MQQFHGHHRATSGSIGPMLASIVISMMLLPSFAVTTQLRAQARAKPYPPKLSPKASIPPPLQPVPKSGDLVEKVKQQLADGHQALGKVSASLMSVQTSVDKTEQSMLGKVLDLQTARSFFSRHEQIDTSNAKLKVDISGLNGQVEGLSSSVSKTQRQFLANGQSYRTKEGKLHGTVVEDAALIQSMNSELAKGPEIKRELGRLTAIHNALMEESANVTQVGAKATTLLAEASQRSRGEVVRHKSLREQLIMMNNYSTKCHASVVKQSNKLGMAMVVASKDSQAVQLTLRQKKKANDATEQRLLAEHALLVSETKKVEKEGLEGINRLSDLRGDLQMLEKNIVEEVRQLEEKINKEKERVKTLTVDLLENQEAELQHSAKKDAMEDHLKELVKEVRESENPVLIATTEAQNEALQAELNEAYVLWKGGKLSETAAALNVDQANATYTAALETHKLAQKMVEQARQEGKKKVVLAVQKAAVSKAKSQELIDKAQAALAERCKADWDQIWKKKKGKLNKCKAMKEELTLEKAKKDSLQQTLKAQTESE